MGMDGREGTKRKGMLYDVKVQFMNNWVNVQLKDGWKDGWKYKYEEGKIQK